MQNVNVSIRFSVPGGGGDALERRTRGRGLCDGT